MTIPRELFVFAFGLLMLCSASVAWSQTRQVNAAGTGVEPKYLIPCGRVISLSDLGDDDSSGNDISGYASPASCAASPQCSAGSPCASSCTAEPSDACQAKCVGPLRAVLDRLVQQIFACPKCDCLQPSCTAPSTCAARPACGCDVPHLPRESAPTIPKTEGNPFRDDSVEPATPPQGTTYRSRQPSLTAQPTPAKVGAKKPVAVMKPVVALPRAETIKPRVALNSPRLLADE
ncbi:MAG: hypothetical protein NTY19_34865 [Planctomycetota bacterium]|nr:hypothetical protein [Planctomycetota bacterium]